MTTIDPQALIDAVQSGLDTYKTTKVPNMKKFLVLAVLGLCACETPAEIAARTQLDAACVDGNLDACVAVQNRVTAEGRNLAITLAGAD